MSLKSPQTPICLETFETLTKIPFFIPWVFLQKLEQTVSSNALLEQELLVLRQKLQASRDSKNNQAGLGHEGGGSAATAVLESGKYTLDK